MGNTSENKADKTTGQKQKHLKTYLRGDPRPRMGKQRAPMGNLDFPDGEWKILCIYEKGYLNHRGENKMPGI